MYQFLVESKFASFLESSLGFIKFHVMCMPVSELILSQRSSLAAEIFLRRLTNFDKISRVIRDRGVRADGVSRVDTVM